MINGLAVWMDSYEQGFEEAFKGYISSARRMVLQHVGTSNQIVSIDYKPEILDAYQRALDLLPHIPPQNERGDARRERAKGIILYETFSYLLQVETIDEFYTRDFSETGLAPDQIVNTVYPYVVIKNKRILKNILARFYQPEIEDSILATLNAYLNGQPDEEIVREVFGFCVKRVEDIPADQSRAPYVNIMKQYQDDRRYRDQVFQAYAAMGIEIKLIQWSEFGSKIIRNISKRLDKHSFWSVSQASKGLSSQFWPTKQYSLNSGIPEEIASSVLSSRDFSHVDKLEACNLLVTSLEISGNETIKEISFAGSASLESVTFENVGGITKINFTACKALNLETIQGLSSLEDLISLDISETSLSGEELFEALKGIESLRELSLRGICDNEMVKQVYELTELTYLDLTDCIDIEDEALEEINGLGELKTLVWGSHPGITNETMQHLAGLSSSLTTLIMPEAVFSMELDEEGFEHFGSLSEITHLDLSSTGLQNEALGIVQALEELVSLNISNCDDISDEGLESLTGCENLTDLDLGGTQITDEGIDSLIEISSLKSLSLAGCEEITSKGIKKLSQLENLTALNIQGLVQLTDRGAKSLWSLPLQTLNIKGCSSLSKEAIRGLGHIPNLIIDIISADDEL